MYRRPFAIVERQGFKKLADNVIEIGAKYGKVKAADLTSVVTTVSRHLIGLYKKKKKIWK